MIRIKVVFADEDERYLKEMRYEFMEKAPQVDLITFTKKEMIYHYFEQGGTADILIVDEGFAEEKLKNLSLSTTRIVLSFSMEPIDGFEIVKKYQRMETLLDTVLLKHAQNNGTIETIRGDSDTRIAVFYSPAGGTGKTTLALALSAAGASAGFNILYMNLEEIDSIRELLDQTSGCLTDVFFALKAEGMNAGIKLKESLGKESSSGFYYLSGVESIGEFEEIDGNNVAELVESIRELSCHDLVILDLSSSFNEKTRRILKAADVVFMPITKGETGISKLQRFMEEANCHEEYEVIFDKISLIINKTDADQGVIWQFPDSISRRFACCANIAVSSVLEKPGDILRAGERLLPLMKPLLQTAMPER